MKILKRIWVWNWSNFNQNLASWNTSQVSLWTGCSTGTTAWTLPHQGGPNPGVNGC